MKQLYTLILHQPIFNTLVVLYNYMPGNDIGAAIIILTIIIKIILYPLTAKSIRSQRDLQLIQPKIQEIQKKYKGQKDVLSQELMKLYKAEKVNPFSSCLPLLVQLPFFIAVFSVFRNGLSGNDSLQLLYPFIQNPGNLNPVSFGFLDLSKNHNLVLAIVAGATQFWQGKMLMQKKPPVHGAATKDEDMAVAMNKQMTYIMPLFSAYISWALPSGLVVYIITTTLLTILQQYMVFRKPKVNSEIIKLQAPQ